MSYKVQLITPSDSFLDDFFVSGLTLAKKRTLARQCREDVAYVRAKFEEKKLKAKWSTPEGLVKLTRMRDRFIQRRVNALKALGEEL